MRAFLDSNVLVYALSSDHAPKRARALALIADLGAAGGLVMSTQVLMETYNVLTRKKGAAPADALSALRLLARHEVVAPGADTAMDAMALAAAHKLSIWDGLIVQAAIEAGCDTLFSEDLQHGRRFGELEVVNPFEQAAHEAPAPAYALLAARSKPKAPATKARTKAPTPRR